MKKSSEKHSIELTPKQFLALLKVVYLGNWMANAFRTGNEKDPVHKGYDDIADYLYLLAPRFGFSEKIEHELEYDASGELTEVSRLHEEYDEETFWDEIIDRLGERDLFEKYSRDEIKKMSREEYFDKLYACQDAYTDEINKHGVERLRIIDKSPYFNK